MGRYLHWDGGVQVVLLHPLTGLLPLYLAEQATDGYAGDCTIVHVSGHRYVVWTVRTR